MSQIRDCYKSICTYIILSIILTTNEIFQVKCGILIFFLNVCNLQPKIKEKGSKKMNGVW